MDFLSETIEVKKKKKWKTLKMVKERSAQPRILKTAKVPSRNKGKIPILIDRKKNK